MAPHDGELAGVVGARFGELEAFFGRCVIAAQRDGTLSRKHDAGDLARLFLGVVLGIRVLARANPERGLIEGVARPALALLDQT